MLGGFFEYKRAVDLRKVAAMTAVQLIWESKRLAGRAERGVDELW